MPNYIFIENSVVVRTHSSTESFDPLPEGAVELREMPPDIIGQKYLGMGEDGMPITEPAPQPAPVRRISVGAFYDRFGSAKWAILADEAAQVRAVVQDASVRRYIDLDNPDLPAGLAILQAAGHTIDPAAIVDAPIQPQELP